MVIKDGAKMSKSKGMWWIPMKSWAATGRIPAACSPVRGAAGAGTDWQETAFEGQSLFWAAFTASSPATWKWRGHPQVRGAPLGDADRKVLRKLHLTIRKVTDDFETRWHFNTRSPPIMELMNEAEQGSGTHGSLLPDVRRGGPDAGALAPYLPGTVD